MLTGIIIGIIIGIVAAVLAVTGFIKLMARKEPSGCLVVFGILFLLLFFGLVILPQVIMAG